MSRSSLPRALRFLRKSIFVSGLIGFVGITCLCAEPVAFDIPPESGSAALLAFSQQAKAEVLFSSEALAKVSTRRVQGKFEPQEAIDQILEGTSFVARRDSRGKFAVQRVDLGSIRGRLLTPEGSPAKQVHVYIPIVRRSTVTDETGEFVFQKLPSGLYLLVAAEAGYLPLQMPDVRVEGHRQLNLDTQTIQTAGEAEKLDPFVVEEKSTHERLFDRGETALPPRTAVGNLDLPRSENDVLPYTIYDRGQIIRSGVVNLNEFLRRELLDGDAGQLPPEQNGSAPSYLSTSSNLNLRGYGSDETVILVNGRRLPEVLTSGSASSPPPPDVNFIPLSLVERVEVLPTSASALYSGNPVGGVINIVLRPGVDENVTEVTTTYTNGFGRIDAPESSASMVHSQSFLGGALRIRLSANITRAEPPTEAELGYHRAHDAPSESFNDPIYRATPNIRSADQTPLVALGNSSVTSVSPGASGAGGLSAFAGRDGVRNFDFFNSPGVFAPSLDSLDYAYGREERRSAYYGSIVYDMFSWLQIGFDGTYAHTLVNRGFDVFRGNLEMKASSPFNPFHQDIDISLNETAPALGQNYSEAQLDFGYAVIGLLLKMPTEWRASIDAQFGQSLTRYRGLTGADPVRWQQLVDAGVYNPLRDTQVSGPPQAFYDQVLTYQGSKNTFVTLGDFSTVDLAARATNESLKLPTGLSTVNVGADYRRDHLGKYSNQSRYGDGTLSAAPIEWDGRTLQQYSVFGEIEAPLVPAHFLPSWLHEVSTDSAVRYIASASSSETNVAPTFGLKVVFSGGLSFRGSVTTSNRFPSPIMSHQVVNSSNTLQIAANEVLITDPQRFDLKTGKNAQYGVIQSELIDPKLRPESAVTQTAGMIFERGHQRRLRISVDFVDTRKVNELISMDAGTVVDLEALFPGRVIRAPLAPGDSQKAGLITGVLTGETNIAWRHSQNWNVSFDYEQKNIFGGTFELFERAVVFTRYDRQESPGSPVVNELSNPDGTASDILKYRANLGMAWFKPAFGFGLDAHFYNSRILPTNERSVQGSDHIDQYWQYDAYTQTDLSRWLWRSSRFGLSAQLRVNNLLANPFPRYSSDTTGSGVQAYGDWRGRVYSMSVTATF